MVFAGHSSSIAAGTAELHFRVVNFTATFDFGHHHHGRDFGYHHYGRIAGHYYSGHNIGYPPAIVLCIAETRYPFNASIIGRYDAATRHHRPIGQQCL
jgi:hypothetical protein